MATVNVSVAPRTGHKMKTTGSVAANVWPLCDSGVTASRVTQISLFCDPNPGKVSAKNLDNPIRNELDFFIETTGADELLL
jgi:hypothetical protein